MIELKGVSKQYLYGAKVLSILDTKIPDGEFISVLGDEGAGKTTFLKIVAGVTDCDGEALLDGVKTTSKTDAVIMQFEDLALFESKSLFFNIAFPLKIRKINKAEIKRRVQAVSELFGLYPSLKTRAYKADLLEQKKTALARLFLRDARVLILDNPTKGLSKEEADELLDLLLPLLYQKKKQGVTILYSTDNICEAMALADRILILHNGKIKQFDSVDEIYSNPKNIWAAQAIDKNYNVFKARLKLVDGNLTLDFDVDGLRFELVAEKFRTKIFEKYIGKEVIVGVHSENLICCKEELSKLGLDEKVVKDEIVFKKRISNNFLQYTKRGFKVQNEIDEDMVSIVPDLNNAIIFDEENENSIFKMIR